MFVSRRRDALKLIIFDRDGTLIEDTGYPILLNDLVWERGALKTIAWLKTSGFSVAVATNQSGVARGYFTLEQVNAFHESMNIRIQSEGGRVDSYVICPHLPGGAIAEYGFDCECRKPKPGLINQLLKEFHVPPRSAVMIGDRKSDVLAGQAAGVKSFLYDSGDLFEFTREAISSSFSVEG